MAKPSVIIAGETYNNVPSISLPKVGGGTAEFYDMSDDLSWLGVNAESLGQKYTESFTLADTTFPSWTPSTTAKSVRATKTAFTYTVDLANYEYYVAWRTAIDVAYDEGFTPISCLSYSRSSTFQHWFRRPYTESFATMEDTYNSGYTVPTSTAYNYQFYFNGSGNITWSSNNLYSIYPTTQSMTFASTSNTTTTVTAKTPTLSCRVNSTYMKSGTFENVDEANTTIKWTCELYRVKVGTGFMRPIIRDATYYLTHSL